MLLLTFPERQDTLSRVGSGGPRYEQKWTMTYTNWPRQTPAFRDSQSNTLTQPYTPQTLSPRKRRTGWEKQRQAGPRGSAWGGTALWWLFWSSLCQA